MNDAENISRKTWSRNIESVNKIGYMDGAVDGQSAVFQSSFDMGYKQGFSFGMEQGFRNALRDVSIVAVDQQENGFTDLIELEDPRKINCQLCMNGLPSEQNVVNLYNTQQEKNTELKLR